MRISGLRAEAVIGVYDWERRVRQELVLDLEMAGDNRRAAASDHVEDALDYAAVSQAVLDYIEGSEFQLIETLAERLAELVLREFDVSWLRIEVAKPGAVKDADSVGVVIERGGTP